MPSATIIDFFSFYKSLYTDVKTRVILNRHFDPCQVAPSPPPPPPPPPGRASAPPPAWRCRGSRAAPPPSSSTPAAANKIGPLNTKSVKNSFKTSGVFQKCLAALVYSRPGAAPGPAPATPARRAPLSGLGRGAGPGPGPGPSSSLAGIRARSHGRGPPPPVPCRLARGASRGPMGSPANKFMRIPRSHRNVKCRHLTRI